MTHTVGYTHTYIHTHTQLASTHTPFPLHFSRVWKTHTRQATSAFISRSQRQENLYFVLLVESNPEEGGATDIKNHTITPATGDDRRALKEERKHTANSTSKCFWNHFQMRKQTQKKGLQINHTNNKLWRVFLTQGGQPRVWVIIPPEICSYQAGRAHHPGGARVPATVWGQRRAWDRLWMENGQQKGKTRSKISTLHT